MESVMFPKVVESKGKQYLYFVESYRNEKGTPAHRNIAALGCIEELFKKKKYKKLLKAMSKIADDENKLYDLETIKENDRIYWGTNAIIKKLWNAFGLDKLLLEVTKDSKVEFNFYEAIFLMLADRFTFPCSKYRTFLNQDKYDKVDKVALHQFYRALDILADNKEKIEHALFKKSRQKFKMKVEFVLYDVSTLYFESVRPDELKEFGYGKDGKNGEVQVVIGLIVSPDGRPIGYEVFPGNLYEGDTLKNAIEKLNNKFKIDKLIFIADQGMLSAENIKIIRSIGYEYVIGARIKNKPEKIKEDILDLSTYQDVDSKHENDVLKIKSLGCHDEKEILNLKKIIINNEFSRDDVKQIRITCKSFANTLLARQIRNHITKYINDPTIMIKKINAKESGKNLLARMSIIKDAQFKNDLLSQEFDKQIVLKKSQKFLKEKLLELGNTLNAALDERIILTWSSKRKVKNQKDRDRLYKKAEKAVASGKPIVTSRGFRKYINLKTQKPTLNPHKKVLEEQWDGFFGIQTNNKDLSSKKISSYYHMLWKIEESFRLLKSLFETRPIYHRTAKRIKGHLMLCFFETVPPFA